MRRLIFIFFILLLSACGFHLRGNLPLAPPLYSLYLKTQDPYGQLSRNLQDFLKISGVHLTDNPADAKTHLVIVNESTAQQLLGISGTQQTRQYNLILTVSFTVETPDGKTLVPLQTLSESRTLTIQDDQILAGSNEAGILYRQMRQAIVYDIMTRLASKNITAMIIANT